MKSTLILIIFSLMFVCIGWLVGGTFTTIFTGIGAAIAVIILIKTIKQQRKEK